MSAVLALPRIDPRIPQSVLPLGRHRANAGLARFMVDAGVLSAADVPDVWNDALDVCERAMEAWLRRHIGPLRCLSPLFVLTMDEKGASTCCVHEAYASAELVWLEGNQQQWAVGAGLEALERAQPGLGGAILDLLNAQQTTYPLFTPAIACDVVSYLHWSGEDNEEAALDVQCGDDEQERAERREQMITQAMLNEAFPAWAQRGLPRPRHALRPGLELLASGIHDPCLRGNVLATLHAIEDADGDPVIGAGMAVTRRATLDMARALGKQIGHVGFLPDTVLYTNGDTLAWWVPPARRHVMFRVDDAHAEAMGGMERGASVPHPGLVFAANSKAWHVWAVKGAARPTPASPLYQAPYFNVYDNGAICRGNVPVPNGTTAEKIGAWNDAFFRSYFSHPNDSQLVNYRGGAYRLWRDLLDGARRRFPERALVPTGKSLGDLLS